MSLLAALLVAVAVVVARPGAGRGWAGRGWTGSGGGRPRGGEDRPGHGRSRRWRPRRQPAGPPDEVPAGVVADLIAAALATGLPVHEAWTEVVDRLPAVGLRAGPGLEEVAVALELAADTGMAPAALVRSAAEQRRRSDVAQRVAAARRLGVLVVLPMGLCLLPAFVVLTVVPVVLALVGG